MTAVRIVRLATGGDGVGKLPDGRTVFVPRTAPGDLIEITAERNHRRNSQRPEDGCFHAAPVYAIDFW